MPDLSDPITPLLTDFWDMSNFHRSGRLAVHLPKRRSFHLQALSIFSSFSTSASESSPSNSCPPPIRVGLTVNAGRGVFASRSIGTGELIHTAQPVVAHPSIYFGHRVCQFCLKKLQNPYSIPESPKTVFFCGEQCEARSKDFYDVEKKLDLSSFTEHCRLQGLKYPLLVKRLACQVITGSISPHVLDILQPEILSSDKISGFRKGFSLLRSTFEDSNIEREKIAFLTEEWYNGVLARIRINAFRIELPVGSYEDLLSSAAASVNSEAAVGNAVYMLPSLYNHDCDPNVNIVWIENAYAKIKALRDIEEGEELRICYIDASMDYEARQALLYQGFGFCCNCLRCVSED